LADRLDYILHPVEKDYFFSGILKGKFYGENDPYLNHDESLYTYNQITHLYDLEITSCKKLTDKSYESFKDQTKLEFPLVNAAIYYKKEWFKAEIKELCFIKDNVPEHVEQDLKSVHGDIHGPVIFVMSRMEQELVCPVCKKKKCICPPPPIPGCTDPRATNYNPNATVNDGSCIYDPKPVKGCTDPKAVNYNPNATIDDGSCVYEPFIRGCTDPNASNYNPNATLDDGSCVYEPKVDTPTGCAPFFWILLVLILVLIVANYPFILIPFLLMLLLHGFSWLMSLLPRIGKFFAHLFNAMLIAALLAGLFYGIGSLINGIDRLQNTSKTEKKERYNFDDDQQEEKIINNDSLITHYRMWEANGEQYSGALSIYKKDLEDVQNFRRINSSTYFNEIGDEYFKLYQHDQPQLKLIYSMLDSIKQRNAMNDKEFINAVVSMVQDIPYRVILADQSCYNNPNPEIRELVNQSNGCKDNVYYGVQSPLEFMGDLYGDCDTRTLLLYTILKHYSYDVAILNSDYFKHSVLGISDLQNGRNINYRGFYINDRYKRYYLWETTAKNYEPGNMPYEYRKRSKWYKAL